MTTNEKRQALVDQLHGWGRVAVAFSGGVDSSLLAAVAGRELGAGNTLLLEAVSPIFPEGESDEAAAFAQELGLPLRQLPTDVVDDPAFAANPRDRCYHCRRRLGRELWDAARLAGFFVLADGANADDPSDYRPGLRASAELGIQHPLMAAGLTKLDIRAWARQLGLAVSEKPSSPCLASRIPYGQPIVVETLRRIDAAEAFLRRLGLASVRCRAHGDVARIEVPPARLRLAFGLRGAIVRRCRELGFRYVCLDLQGFRSGALNEVFEAAPTGTGQTE